MKKVVLLILLVFTFAVLSQYIKSDSEFKHIDQEKPIQNYWFILHRKSNIEYLYLGSPGIITESKLIKTFRVKTGIPMERPTPLPELVDKKYWLITAKSEAFTNPETAPYFLTLNIPVTDFPPFGPEPYLECIGPSSSMQGGQQCQWELPGEFGLHGINGDYSRLSELDPGSSGCIRHTDYDISYLYDLLEPEKNEIRYYVEDI